MKAIRLPAVVVLDLLQLGEDRLDVGLLQHPREAGEALEVVRSAWRWSGCWVLGIVSLTLLVERGDGVADPATVSGLRVAVLVLGQGVVDGLLVGLALGA